MSTQLKQIFASTLIVLAVLVGCFLLFGGHMSPTSAKAGTITVSNLATNAPDGQYSGTQGAVEADLGFFDAAGTVSNILGTLGFGTTVAGAYNFQGVSGSCATKATSTIFAVTNTSSATSTATVIITTTAGSSTLLEVGTTTRTTGLTASAVSPTLVNVTIPTSTQATLFSGVTAGSAGYLSPGASTLQKIVVGPGGIIGAFATDTAPGWTVGFSNCTYKVLWNN